MKHHFAQMTWMQVRDAAAAGRVAIVPVATYEDHGPHVPVDVDVVLCNGICEQAVAKLEGEAILVPPVNHGYSPHHMDFPGTITIEWDTFIRYVRDVCISLGKMGFTRILIVNGHGSNASPLDLSARLTVLEFGGKVMCASVSHWDLRKAREAGNALRDSDFGGTSHACEYETALYLALDPDHVDMTKAIDSRSPLTPSFKTDLIAGTHPNGSGARMALFHSQIAPHSVMGDATKATIEKGQAWLAAAVEGLVDLVREFKSCPIPERTNQQLGGR